MATTSNPDESFATHLRGPYDDCFLTYEPLDTQAIIDSVGDDGAGAVAVFIGTTRNSFEEKTVTRLEYQAYSKMAIQAMAKTLQDARKLVSADSDPSHRAHPAANDLGLSPQTSSSPGSRHDVLLKCAVHHRLGVVPVREPSIVIAVSSPHRKEAFRACEFILEEIKLKAPIWKREFYAGERDGDAQWKANAKALLAPTDDPKPRS